MRAWRKYKKWKGGEGVKNVKKAAKPSIGEHSIMGSSKKNLELTCSIMEGLLECLKGDKIRLVIEVADGTFVVNKYPME